MASRASIFSFCVAGDVPDSFCTLLGHPGIAEVRPAHPVFHPQGEQDEPQSEGRRIGDHASELRRSLVSADVEHMRGPSPVEDLDGRLRDPEPLAHDHLLVGDEQNAHESQGEKRDLEQGEYEK